MTTRLLNLVDTLVLLGLPGFALGMTIWATLTPGNPVGGLVLAWFVSASLIVGGVLATIRKMNARKLVKFYSPKFGISVGWSDSQYEVTPGAFDAAVSVLISKAEKKYPRAAGALRGCLVVFHTPSYRQDSSGRTVAGEQDGPVIVVGWRVSLAESALEHELAHRVLEVCAGDPTEPMAHDLMRQMGVR